MKYNEMIKVIQAAKYGDTIQMRKIIELNRDKWDVMLKKGAFNFGIMEYRIKPKNTWISHDGKTFPKCNPDDKIDVALREGELKRSSIADAYNWRHLGDKYDIIRWRLSE